MTSNSHVEALVRFPGEVKFILSYCHEIGEWKRWREGDELANSCRIGKVERVEKVELVRVGRLLRMGCDSFLMPVRGSVGGGEPLWEQNGLPWEHSSENQWGETDGKTYSVGGKGERERQKA